ncbi:MAG: tRNA pseudouridine(55) synthase TruB [Saprospiraceae bacterium]|nr:tRNA pseudouridine(55) synthase TruB [Saprospiraceae bacterium]
MDDLKNIIAGTCLLVNKPLEWTSFDVVNKVRHTIRSSYDLKKIKVGHAGTLDPLATGLLILCTGKMTKQIDSYQGQDKIYMGEMHLGATTPSYDRELDVDNTYPIDHISELDIYQTATCFVGEIEQIPPAFSAIKKDGIPLYKLARAGKKVRPQPRKVQVHQLDITKIELPIVSFTVRCSKGTYIRSLAHDFGKRLGSGAYLSKLCRTAIGSHVLEDAWNLDELIDAIKNSAHEYSSQ